MYIQVLISCLLWDVHGRCVRYRRLCHHGGLIASSVTCLQLGNQQNGKKASGMYGDGRVLPEPRALSCGGWTLEIPLKRSGAA